METLNSFNSLNSVNSTSTSNINFKENGKFLIRKNMKGILDCVLDEINDFKQPQHIKLKSMSVLFYLVKSCGGIISPHIERILNCLYNNIDTEDDISHKCEETAEMLGLCVDQNIILPLLVRHLSEMEVKNSYQPLFNRIKTLSNVLTKMANISDENVEMILKLMNGLDIFNMSTGDNNLSSNDSITKRILFSSYKIYNSLVNNLGKNSIKFHESIFFPLLLLQSLPETISFHPIVKNSIQALAENCQFQTVEQLYSLELECVLIKFNQSHKSWRRNSPDRFAFDAYVRNGGLALEKHWIDILMIISHCCEADKDIEMRIDMMILVEYILDNSDLSDQIRNYIEFILPEILIPASAWKALRPNQKIRKAALVCMIKLFRNNLIEIETANNFFNEILLILKSTLEDDWDPDMRFLSINLFKHLLIHSKDFINEMNITDIYPHLLKRLDDSQDVNRMLTCEVLEIFFEICIKVRISETTYEYIINTSFIHLDDPNEMVRKSVLNFLKKAKLVNTEAFVRIVERNMNSFVHKSMLKELL